MFIVHALSNTEAQQEKYKDVTQPSLPLSLSLSRNSIAPDISVASAVTDKVNSTDIWELCLPHILTGEVEE